MSNCSDKSRLPGNSLQAFRFLMPAFLLSASMFVFGQTADVGWQLDNTVSAQDREAILSLSRQVGIDEPRRISYGRFLPLSCHFVRVESSVTQDGPRRSWFEIRLRPPESSECFSVPEESAKTVGRWVALTPAPEKHEEWRISDDRWHLDVPFGPGVTYEDARLIVLAVHRGELVNRLSKPTGLLNSSSDLRQIGADDIASIRKNSSGSRTYEVTTGLGGGFILHVRISGEAVELDSYGRYVV